MDIGLTLDLDLAFQNGDFLIKNDTTRDRLICILNAKNGDFILDSDLYTEIENYVNSNLSDVRDRIVLTLKNAFDRDNLQGIEINFIGKDTIQLTKNNNILGIFTV